MIRKTAGPAPPQDPSRPLPGGGRGHRLARVVGLPAAMGALGLMLGPLFGFSFPSDRGSVAPEVEAKSHPPREPEKLVVCYGYADLEGGVATLHPTQTGRVVEVVARENQEVAAGAPLLRLDDRAAHNGVEEARAALKEVDVKLAQAERGPERHRLRVEEQRGILQTARHRLSSAERTLAARQAFLRTEAIGRIRPDPVTTQEVASVAERTKEFQETVKLEETRLRTLQNEDPALEVERLRAEVATMRARLQEAERVLEEQTLRSPEAGKVLRVFVAPGELLSPGSERKAIQFCPDRPRIIRAEVDQAFAARVEVGLPASVEDDGGTGPAWSGSVLRISDWYTQRRQVAEERLQLKDVRTLECLIALDPGQPALRIGQRVRVTIRRAGAGGGPGRR